MSVSAADLGVVPTSVESYLTWVFQMAARWRAVVLIDEADVFLEARSLHDLTRNALVSVFLRQLEYVYCPSSCLACFVNIVLDISAESYS